MKKQILVFYVPTLGLDGNDVVEYVEKVKAEIGLDTMQAQACGVVHQIFFPIRTDNGRVESIQLS